MQELITSQLANIPSPVPTILLILAGLVLILGIKLFLVRKLIGVVLSALLALSLSFLSVKLIGLANSDDIITKNYNVEYSGSSLKLTRKNTSFLLKDNLELKVTHENNQVKLEGNGFSKTIDESEFLKYIEVK